MSAPEPSDHRAARRLNSIMFGALLALAIGFNLWAFATTFRGALAIYQALPWQAHQTVSNTFGSFFSLLVLIRFASYWWRHRTRGPEGLAT